MRSDKSMMVKERILDIEDVGPVLFQRSKRRARSVNISIRLFKPVRVSVPIRVSFEAARGVLLEKIDWVRRHLKKMKALEVSHQARVSSIPFMSIPDRKRKLIDRTKELAKKHDFHYNKLTIRNQRTRWGSCSAGNNISLNMKLAPLPDELVDYIILHELLHTRIKNHGKGFKDQLRVLVGDTKSLNAKIKIYNLGLI